VAEYLLNLIFIFYKIPGSAILWPVYKKDSKALGVPPQILKDKKIILLIFKCSGEFIKLHRDLREEATELG
jgi:hypothetical protein